MKDESNIPQQRRAELSKIVCDHYGLEEGADLDEERLKKAVNLNAIIENYDYKPHGKVYFILYHLLI